MRFGLSENDAVLFEFHYVSLSGAVFFDKVGCRDSPLLPILSQSHVVFISHSHPFCDICQPLRSWPSSAYFPLEWTLQYQPKNVVTSDHVTKVGNFLFFIVGIM